jgi:hypothetical protein
MTSGGERSPRLNNGNENWMTARMARVALLRQELDDQPEDRHEDRRRRRRRRLEAELSNATARVVAPPDR